MKKILFFLVDLIIISAANAQKPEFVIPTGHSGTVNSVAFYPDGRYLVSGSYDKTCKLWDVKTGNEIKTFEGHSAGVNSVGFSPDGKYIVSGSDDNTVKIWDTITGFELKTYEGLNASALSVAIYPCNKYIAANAEVNNNASIILWNTETGSIRTEFKPNIYSDKFVFLQQETPGANRINIMYQTDGDVVNCQIRLLKGSDLLHQASIIGSKGDLLTLVNKIIDEVIIYAK